jgi:hypothetical protein
VSGAIFVVLLLLGPQLALGATPSNEELYQLILQLQEENQKLKEQVQELSTKQVATPTVPLVAAAVEEKQGQDEVDSGLSVEAGVDLMYLDFYASQGADGGGSNNAQYFPDLGTKLTPRYWVEVKPTDHIGLRGRYLHYSQSKIYLGLNRDVRFEILDLELTFPVALAKMTKIKPFIGYRRGQIDLDGSDFGELNPTQFTGQGFTIGTDFEHALFGSPVSLATGFRYSLLYGDTEFAPTSPNSLHHTMVSGYELFVGLDYMHNFGAVEVGARAGWEQQYYGTDGYFPFAIDPETNGDVGLGGPVISLKMKY